MKRKVKKASLPIALSLIGALIGMIICLNKPNYDTYRFLLGHPKKTVTNDKWHNDNAIILKSGIVARTYSDYNTEMIKDSTIDATELKVYLSQKEDSRAQIKKVKMEISESGSEVLLYKKEDEIKPCSSLIYWFIAGLFIAACVNYFFTFYTGNSQSEKQ